MDGALLDWALEALSGYVAADELSEGPYCVLSAVDNRQYKRMLSTVLDHDPTPVDITVFLRRFKTALDDRGLTLKGITPLGRLRARSISGLFSQPPSEPDVILIASSGSPVSFSL